MRKIIAVNASAVVLLSVLGVLGYYYRDNKDVLNLSLIGTLQSRVVEVTLPTGLTYDKTADGWTAVEGVDLPALVGEESVELVSFFEAEEQYVSGTFLLEREKALGLRADQRHAERMLSHQAAIPVEYRDFYLLFPGTIWRDPRGRLCVPCLYWDGGGWGLDFRWLDRDWRSGFRLVRLRK